MDVDVLRWNCRGICNDETSRALKDLISQNRPLIVFLCETKISRKEDFDRLQRALGFMNAEMVLSEGLSGGLGLFWNDEVNLRMGTTSAHHMDAVIVGEAVGDFNEILNNGEKIDGVVRAERQMRGFREALGYGDLLDLGFHRAMATWWNSETQLRLDRAVCTTSWYDLFGHSKLFHLPLSNSDHVPILLKASTTPLASRPKYHRFKFEAFWIHHPECEGVVKEAWGTDVMGTSMFCVAKKIMHTPIQLDKWQKQREKKDLMDRLQILLYQEESFWKQRSKWFEDDVGVENVVTTYFSKMFQASEIDFDAVHTTLADIRPSVNQEMNNQLCASYTVEEVRQALFQMYPTKSPGPDGMPPLFFQHYWEIIGTNVFEVVKSFLHTGQLLRQINFTHICLIPKVDNPEHMSDLRPIALCNVIYKVCSKVIANRLKVILPQVISPFQSAFVPGRLIRDNILVANEIAHFVHNKREGTEGVMALKLDLSKAYDRMEWVFLKMVMARFGFAQDWINMVMNCVSSIRYSFFIRGKPRGHVIPSRGLRQGDPLSPYLFLLGAEGFSTLLQQKQELGLLTGIEVCATAPSINHLLFANDSMIYAQATLENCYELQDVMETYGRASGQLVNFDKSSVAFSKNVSDDRREEVANFLGVQMVEVHEKYLGLPTYVDRKKKAMFQYIKDKLAKKLSVWQGKMLSGAGKDILIRVVASALPTYAMSVFQLTKNFCDDLEQMCARFWWGSTLDKRKIHWKTWTALCSPKEEGGLGFRSLTEFNRAMLAKQAWRILTNPSSLIARIYKAKYYLETSFWEAIAHGSPSYSWRSIFSTLELLQECCCWQVGDGKDIRIFTDNWLLGSPTGRPTPSTLAQNAVSKVSDLLSNTGVWDVSRLQSLFPPQEVELITSIPLSRRVVADRLVWKLTKDGRYSVKSAYRFSFSSSATHYPMLSSLGSVFWKKLWKGGVGFVIRNETGAMLAGGACPVYGLLSPEHGKLLACKKAVEFAIDHSFLPIILETDALNVQRQLMDATATNTSVLGRLYDDLVSQLEASSVLRVAYIGRKSTSNSCLLSLPRLFLFFCSFVPLSCNCS
ncbi:uncharacterized protein LOC112184205 [Rosa chinensis]|uniref:uncharacterized protein LOC112184205 n=1 Tax=Rosa chinensis TaxID=74649 RepID=UPI000D0919CF|nr:uncharacterized protein LOC112184205 [Rosa chinensis]